MPWKLLNLWEFVIICKFVILQFSCLWFISEFHKLVKLSNAYCIFSGNVCRFQFCVFQTLSFCFTCFDIGDLIRQDGFLYEGLLLLVNNYSLVLTHCSKVYELAKISHNRQLLNKLPFTELQSQHFEEKSTKFESGKKTFS